MQASGESALITFLQQSQQRIQAHFQNLLSKSPEDSLHNGRVALRRLVVILEELKVPGSKKALKQAKGVLKRSNKLRDSQVFLEWLKNSTIAANDAGLGALIKSCKRRLSYGDRDFNRWQRRHVPKLLHELRSLTERVVDLGSFTKVTIAKLAPKKLQLLRRSLQKIEGPESAQQLHQARLAAKRLRYTCELYSLAESTEARKLQTVLGRLHDVVVMRALLSSAIYRIAQGNSPVEIQWSLQRTAAPQVVLTFTNFGDFPTCRKLLLRLAAQERKFFMQLKQLL